MALALAIAGGVVGIALGLCYRVGVLVRAIMLAMIFAVAVEVSRTDSFWSTVLTAAVVVTAIQLGYLAGAAMHAVIATKFSAAEG